jgi:hypothetical protein
MEISPITSRWTAGPAYHEVAHNALGPCTHPAGTPGGCAACEVAAWAWARQHCLDGKWLPDMDARRQLLLPARRSNCRRAMDHNLVEALTSYRSTARDEETRTQLETAIADAQQRIDDYARKATALAILRDAPRVDCQIAAQRAQVDRMRGQRSRN